MYFERSSQTFYGRSGLSDPLKRNDKAEQDFCVYNQYRAFVFMQIEELRYADTLLRGPICTTQCKATDSVRRVGWGSRCQYLHECFGLEQEKALVWFTGWSWCTQMRSPFGETQLEAPRAPNVLQTLL